MLSPWILPVSEFFNRRKSTMSNTTKVTILGETFFKCVYPSDNYLNNLQ